MIVNSIFLYFLFIKSTALQTQLSAYQEDTKSQILDIKTDTNSKISDLSSTILINQNDLKSQLNELKATASSDFSGVIEESIPAVVTIRTDIAQGTGFIINSNGYLITNAHVIEQGNTIQALLSDQTKKEAKLIGYSTEYDVAVLKITGAHPFLKLGDSNQVQTGEKVIAIGNPIGLQFSASEGIISGLHRKVSGSPGTYLQTDAALNPGNSGGPLIDKAGEVIGINNFKIAGTENVGFALESNDIKYVVNEIARQKLNQTLIE